MTEYQEQKKREPSEIPLDLPESYKQPRPQENYLPMTDSWLFKGIKDHIGDLPLSVITRGPEVVRARNKIEVLCEYTWVNVTPSQQAANKNFPAVYVPGKMTTDDDDEDDDNIKYIPSP